MKTKIKILGLIFTVIAMTAFIAACSNPAGVDDNWYSGGGGGGSGSGSGGGGKDVTGTYSIGHNLVLTDQVWRFDDFIKDFVHFMGNRPDIKAPIHSLYCDGGLITVMDGTGTITGGQLSFNIGIPSVLLPSDTISHVLPLAKIVSPAETQLNFFLWLFTEFWEDIWFHKETSSGTHGIDFTEVFEHLIFIYADQDATISSPGDYWFDDDSYDVTVFEKHEPYTINLQAGWNIINHTTKTVATSTHDGQTISVSLANLDGVKWRINSLSEKPI